MTIRKYKQLKDEIIKKLSGIDLPSFTQEELFAKLHIHKDEKQTALDIIKDLLISEKIVVEKKRFKIAKEKPKEQLVKGKISVHPRGFGFVTPEESSKKEDDIFIPKSLVHSAVDSDFVEVALLPDSGHGKGREGEIVTILRRGRTHFGGIVKERKSGKEYLVYAPIMGKDRLIHLKNDRKIKCRVGDRILVEVTEFGDMHKKPKGIFLEKIGNIANPADDITAAAKEFDLPDEFSHILVNEAKKLGSAVPPRALEGREDYTEVETVTIDPETAKDFDDALSIRKSKEGHFHLMVHIADVSAYVEKGSALDDEAKMRGNSTYFPGGVIPMLPFELSNVLCSLRPGEIRLTVTVEMEFDPKGELIDSVIKRGYIRSDYRFTYEEAKEVLDGKKKSPHIEALEQMVALCLLLRKKRADRGSVDLSLTEIVVHVDKKGLPIALKEVPYDITHQLVEEFMLKANEVVAITLKEQGKDVVYRIHEEPDPKNLFDLYAFIQSCGYTLPKEPTIFDLQKVLDDAKKSPIFDQLAMRYIRSLKMAIYSPDNVGHYGLALEHYCHFTSPIRRYCDLVIHRSLFQPKTERSEIESSSTHCSERERNSQKAEMSVRTLKKLRLLHEWLKNNPDRKYKAVITKVRYFGLFFEIEHLGLEGFIRVSEIGDDYYEFIDMSHTNEGNDKLVGRGTGKILGVTDEIPLRLLSVDLIELEAKWELYDAPKRAKKKSAPKQKKRFFPFEKRDKKRKNRRRR